MNIREFYPPDEPRAVLIRSNHLGGAPSAEISEQAQQLSTAMGMLVVAYERPDPDDTRQTFNLSLPQELQPSRYIQTAAQTGQDLEARLDILVGANGLRRILTGNSAAALEAILVARAQTLQIDALITIDPTGLRQMDTKEYRSRWLKHQRLEKQLKEGREGPRKALLDRIKGNAAAAKRGVVLTSGFLQDYGQYRDAWNSDIGLRALQDIAESPDFYSLATYLALVGQTFATTTEEAQSIVEGLNGKRPEDTALFRAVYLQGVLHSLVNEAVDYADFIEVALDGVGLSLDGAA